MTVNSSFRRKYRCFAFKTSMFFDENIGVFPTNLKCFFSNCFYVGFFG